MKKLYFFIGFLCIQSLALHAQIKVDANNHLQMPDQRSIIFGEKWAFEHTNAVSDNGLTVKPGLNIYKYHVANYPFFISDDNYNIGIGTGNPTKGKIEIKAIGVNSGITLNPYPYTNPPVTSFSMYLDATTGSGYLTRNGVNSQGIIIAPNGNVGIKTSPSTSTNPIISLNVYGAIHTTYNTWTGSDSRIKSNIKPLKSEYVFHDSLIPFSYNYKIHKSRVSEDERLVLTPSSLDSVDSRVSFGFIAQDVQRFYPNLVMEDENGMLAINYDGFIPVLWESNKDLKTTVVSLENQIRDMQNQINNLIALNESIKDCCSKESSSSKLKSEQIETTVSDISTQSSLSQNRPNPFSQNTIIEMSIPSTITNATLYIYDLKGVQIKSMQIAGRGNTSVTIYASELTAGMFIYSLVTDGVLVGSKQMILTE